MPFCTARWLTTRATGHALCRVRGRRGGSALPFQRSEPCLDEHRLTKRETERGAASCDQGVRRQQVEGHRTEGWQASEGRPLAVASCLVASRVQLTGSRHVSSTQRSTSAARAERFMSLHEHSLHLSGISALGSRIDTSSLCFSFSIEHCMCRLSVGSRSSFLESPDAVPGGGVSGGHVRFPSSSVKMPGHDGVTFIGFPRPSVSFLAFLCLAGSGVWSTQVCSGG